MHKVLLSKKGNRELYGPKKFLFHVVKSSYYLQYVLTDKIYLRLLKALFEYIVEYNIHHARFL